MYRLQTYQGLPSGTDYQCTRRFFCFRDLLQPSWPPPAELISSSNDVSLRPLVLITCSSVGFSISPEVIITADPPFLQPSTADPSVYFTWGDYHGWPSISTALIGGSISVYKYVENPWGLGWQRHCLLPPPPPPPPPSLHWTIQYASGFDHCSFLSGPSSSLFSRSVMQLSNSWALVFQLRRFVLFRKGFSVAAGRGWLTGISFLIFFNFLNVFLKGQSPVKMYSEKLWILSICHFLAISFCFLSPLRISQSVGKEGYFILSSVQEHFVVFEGFRFVVFASPYWDIVHLLCSSVLKSFGNRVEKQQQQNRSRSDPCGNPCRMVRLLPNTLLYRTWPCLFLRKLAIHLMYFIGSFAGSLSGVAFLSTHCRMPGRSPKVLVLSSLVSFTGNCRLCFSKFVWCCLRAIVASCRRIGASKGSPSQWGTSYGCTTSTSVSRHMSWGSPVCMTLLGLLVYWLYVKGELLICGQSASFNLY